VIFNHTKARLLRFTTLKARPSRLRETKALGNLLRSFSQGKELWSRLRHDGAPPALFPYPLRGCVIRWLSLAYFASLNVSFTKAIKQSKAIKPESSGLTRLSIGSICKTRNCCRLTAWSDWGVISAESEVGDSAEKVGVIS